MYLKLSVAGHLTIVPGPHPRPVLDHTASANFMDSRARHPNRGNLDRGVWDIYDATELGVGGIRVGLP